MKKRILSVLFLVIPIVTFAQEKGLDQQIDLTIQSISVNEVNKMMKKIDEKRYSSRLS